MPRYKKVAVTASQRQDWLHRYEVEAQTPPAIAKKDGYDVRTVRKQIELARQERDGREAKLMVLREAMVGHYKDLCGLADDINSEIKKKAPIPEDVFDKPLWLACQQHMPRAKVWKGIEQWNLKHSRLRVIEVELRELLQKKIMAEERLEFMDITTNKGIIQDIVNFFIFQLNQKAQGSEGLSIEGDFRIERSAEQLFIAKIGAYRVGIIDPKKEREQTSTLKVVLAYIEGDACKLELPQEMKNIYVDLNNLQKDIMEELNTVILRRVVPGRCKYCPI